MSNGKIKLTDEDTVIGRVREDDGIVEESRCVVCGSGSSGGGGGSSGWGR